MKAIIIYNIFKKSFGDNDGAANQRKLMILKKKMKANSKQEFLFFFSGYCSERKSLFAL